MDTDAFIAVHGPSWDRLAVLVRTRALTPDEVDELIALYQRTATHLSTVRSTNPDPALTARLSVLLSRARHRIVGSRTPLWAHLRTAVLEDVPAALWTARWAIAIAGGILLGSSLLAGIVLGLDDSLRASLVPEAQQRQLATSGFTSYYLQGEAGGFAAQVWSNNAWVAAQAVVLGVTGFWPVWMLLINGLNVGLMGAVMGSHGRLDVFFASILPHGLLEMTCVVIGAGAGLRLFWAWVRPGPVPRAWALARTARSLVTVAVGLVPVLAVAGLLEAFVTPSGLPSPVRIGIGVTVWAAFVTYAAVLGRRAAARGITGDLSEELVGDTVAVAA